MLTCFLTLFITAVLSSKLFKWEIHQNLKAWLKGEKAFYLPLLHGLGINIAVSSSAIVFSTLKNRCEIFT